MADLICLYLAKEGCQTVTAPSAEAGFTALEQQTYDLVVLDIQLPGMDGFEFLTRFRKNNETPVLVLTARSEDEDLILALGLGADDFLPKPFSPRVLAARVRALLRRRVGSEQGSPPPSLLFFGPYALNTDTRSVTQGSSKIALSAREFDLLRFLLLHPGQPFRPQDLYEAVWEQSFGDLSAVGVYIQRLRRKIEPDPNNPIYLRTERGFGYRFHPAGQEFP